MNQVNRNANGSKPSRNSSSGSRSRRALLLRICFASIGLIALILLTGCASTKQFVPIAQGADQRPSDPNLVRIYLMRPTKMTGAAVGFDVQEGRRMIGKIGPGGHLCWERPPGEVRIVVNPDRGYDPLTFNAEKGHTYYVEWKFGSILAGGGGTVLLNEQDGRKLLAECSRNPKAASR